MNHTPSEQPENDVPSMLRSGGWYNRQLANVRAANSVGYTCSLRNDYVGFRCTLRSRDSRV